MIIEIDNPVHFESFLQTLFVDLTESSAQFELYCNLVYAESSYKREIDQAERFWTFTRRALLDSALLGLFRIYDQHQRSLNMRNLLDTAEANPSWFKSEIDGDQLKRDKSFATEENDIVKKLLRWRHSAFAHRSVKDILIGRNVTVDVHITNEEISRLIENTHEILNRYSRCFHDGAFEIDLFGTDDYIFVLDCIKSELLRRAEARQTKINMYKNE